MNLNLKKPPDIWFNQQYSNGLSLIESNNYLKDNININFGLQKHNDIYNEHYKFTDPKCNFNFNKYEFNVNELIEKIKNEKTKKETYVQSESALKGINTKCNNKLNNVNKTTISFNFRIYPNKKQQLILKEWMNEAKLIYNTCVDIHNSDKTFFNESYTKTKLIVFEYLGEQLKSCPYDTKTNVVAKFYSNLSSCKTNFNNGNIKHFTMKIKDFNICQNLFIPKTAIKEDSFYTSHLNKINGIKYFFEKKNINVDKIGDSQVIYDKVYNKYYMSLSYYKDKKVIQERHKVVSIDVGENVPLCYYSPEKFGMLGKGLWKKILNIQNKIRKTQSKITHIQNCNKEKQQLRINKYYTKIHNIVKEFHNKSALFLCKNYDTILIPVFETQSMISNKEKIKYSLNIHPKCNLSKTEIISMIKNKSIPEINNILNLSLQQKKTDSCTEKLNYVSKNMEELIKNTTNEIRDQQIYDNIIKSYKDMILEMKKSEINILEMKNNIELLKLKELKEKKEQNDKINNIQDINMINILDSILTSSLNKKQIKEMKSIKNEYIQIFKEMKKSECEIFKIHQQINKIKIKEENKNKSKEEKQEIKMNKVEELKKILDETKSLEQKNISCIEETELKNERKNNFKYVLNQIKEKYGEEIGKIYNKKVTKRSKLNKKIKFVLQMLSHYSFREHLKNKSNEYGCQMIVVTEEYTSKTCTKCGYIEDKYTKREKICSHCKYRNNRDYNGARNIFIKNMSPLLI